MQSTPIRDWIPEFPGLHKLIIPKEHKKKNITDKFLKKIL
jgi:hypothetical protein